MLIWERPEATNSPYDEKGEKYLNLLKFSDGQ